MRDWMLTHLYTVLEVVEFIIFLILLGMFVHFNTQIAKEAAASKKIAANTNQVVKSQSDILTAIQSVTKSTSITADKQTSIIICMLQVPISQRTTDLVANCRKQVDFSADDTASQTSSHSTGAVSSTSSPHTTPTQTTPQPNNSQPKQTLTQKALQPAHNLINLIRGIL